MSPRPTSPEGPERDDGAQGRQAKLPSLGAALSAWQSANNGR